MPVPRRVTRFIAGGASRSITATILGNLIRCLYYRKSDQRCHPIGAVKATWIADVFGIDERNIRAARKKLSTEEGGLDLLILHDTPQWYQNRHGVRTEINLDWDRADAASPASEVIREVPEAKEAMDAQEVVEPTPAPVLPLTPETLEETLEPVDNPAPEAPACNKTPAPQAQNDIKTSAPYINKELFPTGRVKNQEPASGGPAGVNTQSGRIKPPTLSHLTQADLTDTQRQLELYSQAVEQKVIGESPADRLRFCAILEHARAYGRSNPPGLAAHLIRRGLWHFVTQDDEDTANERLKRHLFGNPRYRGEVTKPTRAVESPAELSDDAKLVRAAQKVALNKRIRDPFLIIKHHHTDWSRDRYEKAVAELEEDRFQRLSAAESRSQETRDVLDRVMGVLV